VFGRPTVVDAYEDGGCLLEHDSRPVAVVCRVAEAEAPTVEVDDHGEAVARGNKGCVV